MNIARFIYIIIVAISANPLVAMDTIINQQLELHVRCPLCNQSFINDGTITQEAVIALPCKQNHNLQKSKNHFVHHRCCRNNKNELLTQCPYPHCATDIPANYKIDHQHRQKHSYNLLKSYKNKFVNHLEKKIELANKTKNCGICRKDRDVTEFFALGCPYGHEYCVDCLPGWLNWKESCPECHEEIQNIDHVWNNVTQQQGTQNTCAYCSSQGANFAQLNCPHKSCANCLPGILINNKCSRCSNTRNLGIVERNRLQDELARLRGNFILPSQKGFVRVGGLIGLSVFVLPWIAHYWSKYSLQSKLNALSNAAYVKTDMLLGFEFDHDDATLLSLQESFDINKILSTLKKEQQRTALKIAIEQYDDALRNAYDRIVSAYYYQPAANFEQKEPALVQELKERTEQINQLVTEYTQELGTPLRNIFLGIGTGVLSGLGILHITKG